MVAQPARVNRVGDELVPERVHFQQRREPGRVAEVVGVDAPGERRAGGGLHCADDGVHPAGQLLAQEREGQAAEVRSAARAADDHVGGIAGQGKLPDRFLADDSLVQQDMVEHAAERVAGRRIAAGHLDRLADRDAEAAGRVGVLGEHAPAGRRDVRRARMDRRPVRLHQHLAIRLLVVGGAHHPHLQVDAEQRAGEGQRAAPLACSGLGGQFRDALGGVVVGLRHRGVRLVRAGRAAALVLVVDPGRRAEFLLEPARAVQRSWPPEPVDVEDILGNRDVPVRRHLLRDQRGREQRRQVVGAHRLAGTGMQRRRRRRRQVSNDVVPLPGQV